MLCPIAYHAQKRPGDLALVTQTQSLTYRECDQLIDEIPVLQFFSHLRKNMPYCPINTRLPEKIQSQQRERLQGIQGFASCLFTSGSTGTPKIACHTLENHFYSAIGSNMHIPLMPGDKWLLTLPLYHISGIALLFRAFLAGITVLLPGAPLQATHVSLVPTQLKQLSEKERAKFKVILLGGGPIPRELLYDNVYPSYGMTEMSSQIMTRGKVLPYREMEVRDQKIFVRGKTLFAGYHSEDGLIKPFDQEGWFYTGDLTDGTSIWREDRLIISGGENIQPEEIESALCSIEGITKATVSMVPHLKWGERPIAHVNTSLPLSSEQIRLKLAEILPKYKIPDEILPLP